MRPPCFGLHFPGTHRSYGSHESYLSYKSYTSRANQHALVLQYYSDCFRLQCIQVFGWFLGNCMTIHHRQFALGLFACLFIVKDVNAQNVGVGTTAPGSKLSVNGNLSIGSTYASTAAPADGAIIKGNVGIALPAPQVPLHVDGEVFVSAGGVTGTFWNGTANIDGVQINPLGYLGAQRASGSPLHLSKPITYTNLDLIIFGINANAIASVTVAGGGNSVAYNRTSDERLKENIRPTANGLNELMRIQVSDFNFKSRPGRNETGFIAQQLHTVLPEAVTPGGENPAEKPWTVDYGRVTPLLTRAIQQEQAEIDVLKEQNEKLAARLTALDAELKAANDKRINTQGAKITALEAENAKLAALVSRIERLEKSVNATKTKTGMRTVAINK